MTDVEPAAEAVGASVASFGHWVHAKFPVPDEYVFTGHMVHAVDPGSSA